MHLFTGIKSNNIVYVFGSVGVVLINAVALITELILKTGESIQNFYIIHSVLFIKFFIVLCNIKEKCLYILQCFVCVL